jgi:hypothetical protein
MRSWISLAALFLVVVALGMWIAYKPTTSPGEAHAVSELKPAEVQRIRLQRVARSEAAASKHAAAAPSPSEMRVELERRADGWYMTVPFAARADLLQVDRLLAILDARSVARYAATDLARYGLDKPLATVTLNDEIFSYGGVNTMTREQYVHVRGSVYAVPLAQRTAVPRDAESLVSRALFGPNEVPVRFELESFTASLEDGKWTISPVGDDAGPDERNAWVAAWRQASAIQATAHDGRKPLRDVAVALQDGRTITIGILQREPELVLLRSDERIQYHFVADTAKRLLSPPGPAR